MEETEAESGMQGTWIALDISSQVYPAQTAHFYPGH